MTVIDTLNMSLVLLTFLLNNQDLFYVSYSQAI